MPLTENCWNFSEASLTNLPELGLTDYMYVVEKGQSLPFDGEVYCWTDPDQYLQVMVLRLVCQKEIFD